jgi:hypothetical protein
MTKSIFCLHVLLALGAFSGSCPPVLGTGIMLRLAHGEFEESPVGIDSVDY